METSSVAPAAKAEAPRPFGAAYLEPDLQPAFGMAGAASGGPPGHTGCDESCTAAATKSSDS